MAFNFTPEEKAAADLVPPYEPTSKFSKAWHQSTGFCCAQVHNGWGVGFHQCANRPKVYVGRLGFCKTHSPEAVKKRAEKVQASTTAYLHKVSKKVAADTLGRNAIAALREIAAGHNDPRSLARSLLEPFDAKYPPKQETDNG